VRVLTRVLSEHEPLDEAMAALGGEASAEARAWLQEACAGTLRWKGRLDHAIDAVALKKKPTGWLRKALLVAAYQLVVQDRARAPFVVSEAVDQVKKREGEAPARFANALLRKIAAHADSWRELDLPEGARLAEAARWASFPEWLWARIARQRGDDFARAYARAALERPVTWLRARPGWEPEGAWAERGPVEGSWRLASGGPISDKPGFAEGCFIVQDLSSQTLVAAIAADVATALGPAARLNALDLCAAPGGKSVGLAWSGFSVTSTDRDESRMALLRQTVARTAPGVRVVPRGEIAALAAQDLVWVDAPCTGSGILRRHPDVRWLRQEKELAGLIKVQQQLLREAWDKVRPGGFLAYSVCSLLDEEGPQALERAGLRSPSVREWLLAPHEAPYGDGFWAALVRKPG
jgi:16S rRNA (cytosine967-C5)-methyltransferase